MRVDVLSPFDIEDPSFCGAFFPAVAQEKVQVRKVIMNALGENGKEFTVRYVGGGVKLQRKKEGE